VKNQRETQNTQILKKKKIFQPEEIFFCSTNPSCKTGVIDEGINVGRRQINQGQK